MEVVSKTIGKGGVLGGVRDKHRDRGKEGMLIAYGS